jgi:hypothetical protein
VDVVRHQAIRRDLDSLAPRIGVQQTQVGLFIADVEEDSFAVIAPLRDVVRNTWEDGSGLSWHPQNLLGVWQSR